MPTLMVKQVSLIEKINNYNLSAHITMALVTISKFQNTRASQEVTSLSHFQWTEMVKIFMPCFQYMFYIWVQNGTLIASFFSKILNVKHS